MKWGIEKFGYLASMALLAACGGTSSGGEADGSTASIDALPTPPDAAPPDAACQADLQNDPMNCGSCGHVCCGDSCSTGVCDPVLIDSGATHTSQAVGIVLEEGHELFVVGKTSEGAGVFRVDKGGAGGTAATPLYSGEIITGLALDEDNIYYTVGKSVPWSGAVPTDGRVYRIARSGGEPVELIGGLSGALGLAVDDKNLYVSSRDAIDRVSLATGAVSELVIYPAKTSFIRAATQMVVDADSLYYSVLGARDGDGWVGSVMKVSKTGGTPLALAEDVHILSYVLTLADDTLLVRTDYEFVSGGGTYPKTSKVLKLPTTGGTPIEIAHASSQAANSGNASPIETDGTDVYFMSVFDVSRAPIAGGAPEVLYPLSGYDMAMDDSCIYVTDGKSEIEVITR